MDAENRLQYSLRVGGLRGRAPRRQRGRLHLLQRFVLRTCARQILRVLHDGPFAADGAWWGRERAKYQQEKSLPSTQACCASHRTSVESPKATKREAFGVNVGSQPGAPNRFTQPQVGFAASLSQEETLTGNATPPVLPRKNAPRPKPKPNQTHLPRQAPISSRFQDTQKKKVPRTDIGASPRLSALFLLLGGGRGGFHAEHGLEARGAAVNPLAAFVVLRQGEKPLTAPAATGPGAGRSGNRRERQQSIDRAANRGRTGTPSCPGTCRTQTAARKSRKRLDTESPNLRGGFVLSPTTNGHRWRNPRRVSSAHPACSRTGGPIRRTSRAVIWLSGQEGSQAGTGISLPF